MFLCNSTFCASCDLPPHAPATCEIVSKWEEKGAILKRVKEEDASSQVEAFDHQTLPKVREGAH